MKKILVCLLILIVALTAFTACKDVTEIKGGGQGDDDAGTCDHTGGEATCTTLAVCTTCGESYGELNPEKHEKEQIWIKEKDTHVFAYECCKAAEDEAAPHDWSKGECPTCEYVCTHEMDEKTNACKFCGYKKASEGLKYILVESKDTSYYKVSIGNCTDEDIVIPPTFNGKDVTTIDTRAFKDCAKIRSVTLPDTITKISTEAFYGCYKLKSITIPASVENIGKNAFTKCAILKNVTFETTSDWLVKENEKDTTGTTVKADTLADTTKAANLLKTTHKAAYWALVKEQ